MSNDFNEQSILDEAQGITPEPEEMEPEAPRGFSLNLSWLKAPTGEGTVEDRLHHPLNPEASMGIAQIIRGVEGLLGNLSLAIVDIVFGMFRVMEEKRHAAPSSGL